MLSLPGHTLVHTHKLEGMGVMGLAADPWGGALAVSDSATEAIHVLAWPGRSRACCRCSEDRGSARGCHSLSQAQAQAQAGPPFTGATRAGRAHPSSLAAETSAVRVAAVVAHWLGSWDLR